MKTAIRLRILYICFLTKTIFNYEYEWKHIVKSFSAYKNEITVSGYFDLALFLVPLIIIQDRAVSLTGYS